VTIEQRFAFDSFNNNNKRYTPMTIENPHTMDYLAYTEAGDPVLIVKDHLPWDHAHDRHLFLMWRKIANYGRCLRSPVFQRDYGVKNLARVLVVYGAVHPFSPRATDFFDELRSLLPDGVLLHFKQVPSPGSAQLEDA
jgi:hypothetical protein